MHSPDTHTTIGNATVLATPRTPHHDDLDDALRTIREIRRRDERGRYLKLTGYESGRLWVAMKKAKWARVFMGLDRPPAALPEAVIRMLADLEFVPDRVVEFESDGVRHAVHFTDGGA